MQQQTLQPPAMRQPTVLLVVGRSGVGKSALAHQLAGMSAGRMSIVEPPGLHSPFSHEQNWADCDVLALDEMSHWDADSLRPGFARLEEEATRQGKKLMLILQDRSELQNLGITLREEPAVLEITSPSAKATLTYQGKANPWP